MPALALEIATYEQHLPRLLAASPDRFVLIKGEQVEGVFTEQDEALYQGYLRFPDEDFLVRQILAHQPVRSLPSILGRR